MVSRRGWTGLCALVLVVACTAERARAQDLKISPKEGSTSLSIGDATYSLGDGLLLGPIHLHPFLRQRLDFDDNTFLDHEHRTMAFLYECTGGLRADLLPGNHEISAGYKARGYARLYNTEPSLSTPAAQDLWESRVDALNRLEHVADFRGALNFPWSQWEAGGSWERLNDPLNFDTTRNVRRDVWGANASARLEAARLRLDAAASVRRYDFYGPFDYLDDLQGTASLQAGALIASKLYALLGYSYLHVLYDEMSAAEAASVGQHGGFESHTATLGLQGSLLPKMEILLKAGVTLHRVLDGVGDGLETSFFGQTRVKWTATERFWIEASYLRDFQISQFASFQTVDRGDLAAGYAFSYFVSCRLYGHVENTSPSEGDGFLRWGFGVQAEYRMFSWLILGTGYEFRARATSIPDGAFQNHRAWVHLTVVL
jgi:hypothetical protein